MDYEGIRLRKSSTRLSAYPVELVTLVHHVQSRGMHALYSKTLSRQLQKYRTYLMAFFRPASLTAASIARATNAVKVTPWSAAAAFACLTNSSGMLRRLTVLVSTGKKLAKDTKVVKHKMKTILRAGAFASLRRVVCGRGRPPLHCVALTVGHGNSGESCGRRCVQRWSVLPPGERRDSPAVG